MDTDLMTAPGILARLRLLLDMHRRPSRNTLTELCDQIEQQLADAAAEEASHWARLEAARRRVWALTGELQSITDVALDTVAQVLATDSSDYVEPDQAAPAGLARPCGALSPSGDHTCELEAGHDGSHSVSFAVATAPVHQGRPAAAADRPLPARNPDSTGGAVMAGRLVERAVAGALVALWRLRLRLVRSWPL